MFLTLLNLFQPLIDALFVPNIPFHYRWRLFLLQPMNILAHTLKYLPWAFSNAYNVIWIPTRNKNNHVRAIVFRPNGDKRTNPSTKSNEKDNHLRPLHVSVHGGAFIGGIAEFDARFCLELCERTGAVVVSTEYRLAPRHTFPAAHEDVIDVLRWLSEHAEELGASPSLLTLSGFSAGGNLAIGATVGCKPKVDVKAAVTFYNPVDLRLPPWEKRKPPGFPTKDPAVLLLPLMDAYAGLRRLENIQNPVLHPILADVEDLPQDMLFVIPTMDILLDEQLRFVERLQEELRGTARQVKSVLFEGQLHGWIELPSFAIEKGTREAAFDVAIQFVQDTHRKHGWDKSSS